MILIVAIVLLPISWFTALFAGMCVEEHHRASKPNRELRNKALSGFFISIIFALITVILFYLAGAA